MSATREFQCPGCQRTLFKSDAMMALSEIHQGGGGYMATGTVDMITCPGCGHSIDVREVIAGTYDRRAGLLSTLVGLAILGVIIFFVVRSCSG